MAWLYLALSSTILFTTLDLIQRVVAIDSKYPRAAAVVFNVTAMLLAVILFFLTGGQKDFILPKEPIAWIFMFSAVVFYGLFERGRFFAAKMLDASVFTIISNITLPITFIGTIFLYSESVSINKIVGIALILLALIVVSIQKNIKNEISLKGILLATGMFIFLGLAWVLDKKGALYFGASGYNIIVWTLPVVFVYLPYVKRSKIVYEFKLGSWKIFIMALINVVGYFLQLKALQIGQASKVIPIVQLASLFTVIAGIYILKEKDYAKQKIFAGVVAILGAYLLSIA